MTNNVLIQQLLDFEEKEISKIMSVDELYNYSSELEKKYAFLENLSAKYIGNSEIQREIDIAEYKIGLKLDEIDERLDNLEFNNDEEE